MSEWTAIDSHDENTFPDPGNRVIGYGKNMGICVVKLACVGPFPFWAEGVNEEMFSFKEISHWMPLPEPPKETNK